MLLGECVRCLRLRPVVSSVSDFNAYPHGLPELLVDQSPSSVHRLSEQDLNKILLEVKKETVEAFANSASYFTRKERLERLIELLH